MPTLFKDTLQVVNVGLTAFADNVVAAGVDCVRVQWQPPALGDRAAAGSRAQLVANEAVDRANQTAFARFLEARPLLLDIATAREVVPGMDSRRRILHAGPPIAWRSMCGPMRGAILGAVVLEGWADTVDAARRIVDAGEIDLAPNHHHAAVGPMAGIISPSMPVWVVENATAGNR